MPRRGQRHCGVVCSMLTCLYCFVFRRFALLISRSPVEHGRLAKELNQLPWSQLSPLARHCQPVRRLHDLAPTNRLERGTLARILHENVGLQGSKDAERATCDYRSCSNGAVVARVFHLHVFVLCFNLGRIWWTDGSRKS